MDYEQLTEGFEAALTASGLFKVEPFDLDIATPDRVKRLAGRLGGKPVVLVNLGDSVVAEGVVDTTGVVTRETLPLEVIVAHRNYRGTKEQRVECRTFAFNVRQVLQGLAFEADNFAKGAVVFDRTMHRGTSPEVTIYSVFFNITGNVDVTA